MQESHWSERHTTEDRADPYKASVASPKCQQLLDSFQNVSLEMILSQPLVRSI